MVRRRGLLASAGLAAAGLAWGQAAEAQKPAPPPRPRDLRKMPWKPAIGLNGFASTARERPYPLWEILEFAAGLGYVGVELVEGWPSGATPSRTTPSRGKGTLDTKTRRARRHEGEPQARDRRIAGSPEPWVLLVPSCLRALRVGSSWVTSLRRLWCFVGLVSLA